MTDEESESDDTPDDESYCERHDIDIDDLVGYDHCPYCRMESDRQHELAERAQRHAPRSVDDPASIDAYRR